MSRIYGVLFFAVLFSVHAYAQDETTSYKAMQERLSPLAKIRISESNGNTSDFLKESHAERSGKTIYESTCIVCHETGAVGAPRAGDKNAWRPRIAQGLPTLLKHALQGYHFMPPRGNCFGCSDAEIKSAVQYLLDWGNS